jgi:hypothetical protein
LKYLKDIQKCRIQIKLESIIICTCVENSNMFKNFNSLFRMFWWFNKNIKGIILFNGIKKKELKQLPHKILWITIFISNNIVYFCRWTFRLSNCILSSYNTMGFFFSCLYFFQFVWPFMSWFLFGIQRLLGFYLAI